MLHSDNVFKLPKMPQIAFDF